MYLGVHELTVIEKIWAIIIEVVAVVSELIDADSDELTIQVLEATDLAFISMSRPLLRQPDLPHLWESGDNEPATCISCSRCFGAEDVDCVFHKKEEVAGFKKEFARTV